MSVGVIQFPGSNCDQDALHAVTRGMGVEARMIWHKDDHLGDLEVVIIPGGTHMVFAEKPDLVNQAIEAFLRTLQPRK